MESCKIDGRTVLETHALTHAHAHAERDTGTYRERDTHTIKWVIIRTFDLHWEQQQTNRHQNTHKHTERHTHRTDKHTRTDRRKQKERDTHCPHTPSVCTPKLA